MEATSNGLPEEGSADFERPRQSLSRKISSSLRFNVAASSSSSSAAAAATATTDMTLSPPPPSSSFKAPRRSLAHQPRLLGYEDATPLVELRGLSSLLKSPFPSSSNAKKTASSSPKDASAGATFARGPARGTHRDALTDEDQFRIGEEEEEDGEGHGTTGSDDQEQRHSTSSSRRNNVSVAAPIDIDSYSGPKGHQLPHRETSSILPTSTGVREDGDDTIEDLERGLYAEEDDDEDAEVQLLFEPTTKREKAWMWTSVALVVVLTIVSVSIAVDWIDWPGDGLGAD